MMKKRALITIFILMAFLGCSNTPVVQDTKQVQEISSEVKQEAQQELADDQAEEKEGNFLEQVASAFAGIGIYLVFLVL